jgi:hypothetical protein
LSWLPAVLLALSGFGSAAAPPQAAAAVLGEFGLLGTWSIDCSHPPSVTNSYAIFRVPAAGFPSETFHAGAGYTDNVYTIQGVERPAADRLMLHMVFESNGNRQDSLIVKSNSRIRTWWSRRQDGTITVSDGKIHTAADRPTDWLTRCGD